ncbi:MAG: iron-sulfur cluster assembly scaffold protein [Candidatus Micrarchaeia archaeon]
MSLDIYAEQLLQNWEHPHNRGKLENASISWHEENTSCGDQITVYINVKDGKIDDVKFEGIGCTISMGSASITTDYVKGKDLKSIEKMGPKDVIKIIGVDPGPSRLHCATLAMRAIKLAVLAYEKKKPDADISEL